MVDEEIYSHVQDCTFAKLAWDTLAKMYDDRGLPRRVGLLRRLITTSLNECKSVDVYVNLVIATAKDLNGPGFPISKEWVGSFLLAGLGDKYKPLIMALENSGTPITGDAKRTKLLQKEGLTDEDNKAFKAFQKPQRIVPAEKRTQMMLADLRNLATPFASCYRRSEATNRDILIRVPHDDPNRNGPISLICQIEQN